MGIIDSLCGADQENANCDHPSWTKLSEEDSYLKNMKEDTDGIHVNKYVLIKKECDSCGFVAHENVVEERVYLSVDRVEDIN